MRRNDLRAAISVIFVIGLIVFSYIIYGILDDDKPPLRSGFDLNELDRMTWSDPVELPGSLTGDRHQAVYAPDGRLFISFRDTCLDTLTPGDWVGWVGTYDDIVAGREGQYRVRLMENTHGADCAYHAIGVLPDGTVFTTTYGHWSEGQEPFIAGVHFTMSEIDAAAASL